MNVKMKEMFCCAFIKILMVLKKKKIIIDIFSKIVKVIEGHPL